MRTAFCTILLLAFTGCGPRVISSKEYNRKCQETVNLHNTLIGQVWYQGSKNGYDYFLFEPFGSLSHRARVREGDVPLQNRFSCSPDPKNWVVVYPVRFASTNLIIQSEPAKAGTPNSQPGNLK